MKVNIPCFGTLSTVSWAGTLRQKVKVVGEIDKYYRIEALKRTRIAGRRRFIEAGVVVRVPKYAVQLKAQ